MKHVNPTQVIQYYKNKGINCYAYFVAKFYDGEQYVPLRIVNTQYKPGMIIYYFSEPLLNFTFAYNSQASRSVLPEPDEILKVLNIIN